MIKIGLDIQPILKDKTGVGWYTQKIVENLQSNIFEFEGYGFNFLNRNRIDDEVKNLNFNYKINSLMPYGVYRRIWHILPVSFNALFESDADIFHFFNYIVPPKIRGRIIVTIYDMVYKLFPETMARSNYKRLEKELKSSADRADKIVTISMNSKKEIMEYLDVAEDRIDIVYPGIDANIYSKDFPPQRFEETKAKYRLPSRYILYLGTLEPRKNIGRIIDAYVLFIKEADEEINLVIAGKKGWMFDEIFKKVEDYGLEDKIIFTGYVDEGDKPLIYKMSDLFIFPSLYEGFGMPVLEAMAAGVPVITSNTSALPEVAGDAALLINPLDVEDIAYAIKKLMKDEALRNSLIQKGQKRSRDFSWKKSAEKLLDIYREVGGS